MPWSKNDLTLLLPNSWGVSLSCPDRVDPSPDFRNLNADLLDKEGRLLTSETTLSQAEAKTGCTGSLDFKL